jgi:catechol 2,3-dioxygenase-like lactoylglutathione lyase family enzyme
LASGGRTIISLVLDHIGFEVSDLGRAGRFYDAVFYALGIRRMHSNGAAIAYGVESPVFWITARNGPSPGYGHVALRATGKVAVDAAHAAGVAHGGSDAGAPGARPRYGSRCYAAYLRDPDGLRVELVSGGRSEGG